MAENTLPLSPFRPRPVRFLSLRESCLHLLRDAKTTSGRPFPMTAQEMVLQLEKTGMCITTCDLEGLLRELCQEGLIQEIDPVAGYRWVAQAA